MTKEDWKLNPKTGSFEKEIKTRSFKKETKTEPQLIKKDSKLPISIVIAAIIIAIAIYLGTTSEFRHKESACKDLYGKELDKVPASSKNTFAVIESRDV